MRYERQRLGGSGAMRGDLPGAPAASPVFSPHPTTPNVAPLYAGLDAASGMCAARRHGIAIAAPLVAATLRLA